MRYFMAIINMSQLLDDSLANRGVEIEGHGHQKCGGTELGIGVVNING